MGMYDTILVKCPSCGEEHHFQSKSGECLLSYYELEECPEDVMWDANRHSPYQCGCGLKLEIDVESKKVVVVK